MTIACPECGADIASHGLDYHYNRHHDKTFPHSVNKCAWCGKRLVDDIEIYNYGWEKYERTWSDHLRVCNAFTAWMLTAGQMKVRGRKDGMG